MLGGARPSSGPSSGAETLERAEVAAAGDGAGDGRTPVNGYRMENPLLALLPTQASRGEEDQARPENLRKKTTLLSKDTVPERFLGRVNTPISRYKIG